MSNLHDLSRAGCMLCSPLAKNTKDEAMVKKRRLWYDFLNQLGISVVRYSNDDINRNFDGVCADLLRRLALTDIE